MEQVIKRIRGLAERHESELLDFLRIPCISSDPSRKQDMEAAARWLLEKLQNIGVRSEIIPTAGHDIVYAEHLQAEGAPTVLIYGHYDVQPVDPLDLWISPPFEPEIREGKIFARGSSDDKGQLLGHVLAVEAFLTVTESMPVNVKMVLEGEEEVGSPNLKPFIEENRERLSCDVVMVSDSAFFGAGVPSLVYGLRGLAYVEVRLRGPNRDLHSGTFGGAVCNPADALARMIASLHDADRRVTIPGFYDRVRELTPAEREGFARLPYDDDSYREDLGVEALEGESGFTTLERTWARPTLEVNGIWGGFSGEGAKTVLPGEAGAKLSMRLVPHQDPDEIADAFEEHMRRLAPAGVELSFMRHHGGHPYLAEPDSPFIEAGKQALAKAFGAEPILTREGGSIPVVETFETVLGAPTVLMGFGLPDDNPHSPNEKMNLEQFHKGIEAAAHFMSAAGELRD